MAENMCNFSKYINVSDYSEFLECVNHFSKVGNSLSSNEFRQFIYLFAGSEGKLSNFNLSNVFSIFDKNEDGMLDSTELKLLWQKWMQPLMKPVSALVIIDVQNDFIDGSLALKDCPAHQDGKDVIPIINNLIERLDFDVVCYSLDCHPNNHISFFENIDLYKHKFKNYKSDISLYDTLTLEDGTEQKLWPKHCVQHTWGCELHKDLIFPENSLVIYKGLNPEVDSYSAVYDNRKDSESKLREELNKRNVSHVFICGLALDCCVAYTASDVVDLGFATVIIEDATAGIDENSIKTVKEKLVAKNCVLCKSCEVEDLMKGKSIKTEFSDVFLNNV